jgi:predicted nuclease with TOPRIM domain
VVPHKLKRNDYDKVGVPHPLSKEDRESEIIFNELKGVQANRSHVEEYMKELIPLVERLDDRISNLGKDGMWESDLMNELLPESRGKTGKDLEPYQMRFDDAMYTIFKAKERGKYKKIAERLHADWKREHGYLEGK